MERHGTYDGDRWIHGAPETRFWRYVDKSNDCWLWQGAKGSHGYGMFHADTKARNQKPVLAHRFAYGENNIPKGLTIDHLCGIKLCVNPSHLEPVTTQENTRRYHDQKVG